jgi:hypothetical protein
LRNHKESWPAEVQLTAAANFPAMLNGKVIGSVKVPVATRVSIVTIEADTAVAGYSGSTSRVPIAATDLAARAKLAMEKPAPAQPAIASLPTPAPMPSVTPKPKTPEELAAEEKWRSQFQAGKTPLGQRIAAPTPSRDTGRVTYTLHKPEKPTPQDETLWAGIEKAVVEAVNVYNRYTSLKTHLEVTYNAGVPTADGNINGSIRVGKSRNSRVILHEIGHCMGVGQHAKWATLMVNGRWQGERANKLLLELTNDPTAELHGDRMHFWPYGLNYDNEMKSEEDRIRHAKLVEAMMKDLEKAR